MNLASRDNIFAGLQIKLQTVEHVSTANYMESDNMSVVSMGQQSQIETKMEKRKKKRKELLKSKLL